MHKSGVTLLANSTEKIMQHIITERSSKVHMLFSYENLLYYLIFIWNTEIV